MKFHQDAYRTQLWSLQMRGKKTYVFCSPDAHTSRSVPFPMEVFARREEDEEFVESQGCKSRPSKAEEQMEIGVVDREDREMVGREG